MRPGSLVNDSDACRTTSNKAHTEFTKINLRGHVMSEESQGLLFDIVVGWLAGSIIVGLLLRQRRDRRDARGADRHRARHLVHAPSPGQGRRRVREEAEMCGFGVGFSRPGGGEHWGYERGTAMVCGPASDGRDRWHAA